MAPKSDRKYAEVFDALEKVGQFTQDKRQTILNTALSAPTAGLPINQIKGAIGNTIDGIKSAGKFANNNPLIQGVLDNEYLNLASGLNPVTGAAFAFGNLSKLAGSLNPNNSKTKSRPKASGTKIKIGDKYYDTGFHSKEISELRKQNPGGGNAAQSVTTGLNTGTGSRDARLDPNAKDLPGVMYVTNFKEGQTNMDAMQDYFKGQKNGENLATWAKANPALAYKEYSKAMSKEKAADMAAYKEDYGSPMNQQSEVVFEQGKPTVTNTSMFDVLNSPSELSTPGKAAYDLAMANTNFIGQQDIPAADNTQEFLTTQMKKLGLVK